MSRRPAAVTQADVARALRAVKASGGEWQLEIRPGGVIAVLPLERGRNQSDLVPQPSDDGSSIVL